MGSFSRLSKQLHFQRPKILKNCIPWAHLVLACLYHSACGKCTEMFDPLHSNQCINAGPPLRAVQSLSSSYRPRKKMRTQKGKY